MKRLEAIAQILSRHEGAAVVLCNGLNSRETAFKLGADNHLYLLHAMGEALAVGVGLRMARPDLEVVVIDGDANALMGASAHAFLPVEGLHYYVLDNGCSETTGGQALPGLPEIAFGRVVKVDPGKIESPNPPPPKAILATFKEWVRRRESTNKKGV